MAPQVEVAVVLEESKKALGAEIQPAMAPQVGAAEMPGGFGQAATQAMPCLVQKTCMRRP